MDLKTTGLSLFAAAIEDKYLSTGCELLNKFLRGGISKKGVTQIYGESATGKTQIALQLCLTAQIPDSDGNSAGVVYICTEAAFPSKRLKQLLDESPIARRYNINGDSIFVEHVATVKDLESCVVNKVPCLLSNKRINLLIIDSIAAPYRSEYEEKELKSRAHSLRKIGEALHRFSRELDVAVVCINQVSAVINRTVSKCSNKNQPALGIIWSSQITNSLCLCKINDKRHIHIIQSPYLGQDQISFEINLSGVNGLPQI